MIQTMHLDIGMLIFQMELPALSMVIGLMLIMEGEFVFFKSYL